MKQFFKNNVDTELANKINETYLTFSDAENGFPL
jgi:hypothetical protein